MATTLSKIIPCLWFDGNGEEAAKLYTSLFPNSRITKVTKYGAAGEAHGLSPDAVLTAEFEIDGTKFLALNGGPQFKFTEAVSFQIMCDTQAEVDHYWDGLLAGGGEESRCGWLKDRFGLSWQVVPRVLTRLISEQSAGGGRAMRAMMGMAKLDIAALEKAYRGE